MAYLENDFGKYIERIHQQQVVGVIDTPGLRVLQGDYSEVNFVLRYTFEDLFQPHTRHKVDALAEKFCGGILAESASFPLKSNLDHGSIPKYILSFFGIATVA
jgi:hypothetical protein